MAEYVLQEMNGLHTDGKPRMYPRMIRMRTAKYDAVVKDLHDTTGVSTAQVKAVLDALSQRMAFWFSINQSVKIDGLGLFSPTLGVKSDKEIAAEEVSESNTNADRIKIDSVTFRADNELLKTLNRRVTLERSQDVKTIHPKSSPYTKEERKQMLLDYLDEHPYIKCLDYCRLVKMRRTSGYNELRNFLKDGIISHSGTGPCLVYVKADKE